MKYSFQKACRTLPHDDFTPFSKLSPSNEKMSADVLNRRRPRPKRRALLKISMQSIPRRESLKSKRSRSHAQLNPTDLHYSSLHHFFKDYLFYKNPRISALSDTSKSSTLVRLTGTQLKRNMSTKGCVFLLSTSRDRVTIPLPLSHFLFFSPFYFPLNTRASSTPHTSWNSFTKRKPPLFLIQPS